MLLCLFLAAFFGIVAAIFLGIPLGAAVALISLVILLALAFRKIPANTVGIPLLLGGKITEDDRSPGWHFFLRVIYGMAFVPTGENSTLVTFEPESQDGISVQIKVRIYWRVYMGWLFYLVHNILDPKDRNIADKVATIIGNAALAVVGGRDAHTMIPSRVNDDEERETELMDRDEIGHELAKMIYNGLGVQKGDGFHHSSKDLIVHPDDKSKQDHSRPRGWGFVLYFQIEDVQEASQEMRKATEAKEVAKLKASAAAEAGNIVFWMVNMALTGKKDPEKDEIGIEQRLEAMKTMAIGAGGQQEAFKLMALDLGNDRPKKKK